MSKVMTRLVGALLAVAVLVAPVSQGWAQSRPVPTRSPQAAPLQQSAPSREAPVSGKVSVEMMVIYAHNEDNRVDPALRGVMQQLKNFRFSGYKLLENHPTQLAVGQETSFALPGGRKIKMELLDRDDQQARIRIRMFSGSDKVLDTTVSIHRNRSFMIGGPSYEAGKLILPVSVRY